MLLTRDSFRLCYFYVICVFCRLVVLIRLSVPVQVHPDGTHVTHWWHQEGHLAEIASMHQKIWAFYVGTPAPL